MENPVFTGSISLIAGNILGSSANKITELLGQRLNITATLSLSPTAKSLLDTSLSILLHAGLVGLGTHFVSKSFPWLTEDPAAFSLFILGLLMSSGNLSSSLNEFNRVLWLPTQSLPRLDSEPVAPVRT